MKTLKLTKTWILICSILVVPSASEHASSHHDVSGHGDSASWKKYQNTIVPYGIQMPNHVLSTQDISCISADNNIFEIMNKAQETCSGTDLRCTFYHFLNHGYENLGTLDINKERFDDLLMKFDNWLLTDENIEKSGDSETKGDSSLETASIGVNDVFNNANSSISTDVKCIDASQGGHIDKLNLNITESDDDRVHRHHLKNPHEIRHKIRHDKDDNSVVASNIHGKQWKNESRIKLKPEYNADHRYFEVYIPEDKVTGKPRTIYVEVDQDKNEFVLLDEEINRKLNGKKPIKIELDELSGIADTAFNEVAKTSNFEKHVHNHLNDDEKAIINDISKHSAVDVDEVHLDVDVGKQTQNSINPSVYHHNIYNIEAEQHHKVDNMTGNVKEIINGNKSLTVPYKYINQAQFNMKSNIDNSLDDMQNDHFELLETNNTETDIHTDFYENEEPFDTIEYNYNNTFDSNRGTENSSLEYSDISYENDNDTSTDYYELPTEHENETLHDDSFVQVEEHNDTYHDIDYDVSHDFSSSNTLNLNEFTVQVENPVQGNKLKSTLFNDADPKLTSSVNGGISDYTVSPLHAMPLEIRQGYTNLHDLSLEPSIPLKPYTNVPILGKDSAKILKTDSYLTSPSPAHATLDLHADDSQNTPTNSVVENPSITSYISPLGSTPSAAPKMSQYSPPVECIVRPNQDSKYSPLNFGVSWLPSDSRIVELRLPCDMNPLSSDHVFSPQASISPLTLPSMEYIGSSQSSPERTTPVKETTLNHSVPSSSYVIQEPSLITTPCELETTTPMPSKHVLFSKLGLPKSNTGYESISVTNPSSVKPCSLQDAVSSPCPIQQILPCLQKNILSPIDLGLINLSPCETMIPCSDNSNRYPYTTIPYFSNPYLKSSQFIPSYLEPLLQTPLQPASKIPILDSVPMSVDQITPCLTGVNPHEKKTIQLLPFAPNSQFSSLNAMLVRPGFPPPLPCPNIWNNIPYLPYTDQNIRNNPSYFLSNYITATTDQRPLPSKTVPLSVVQHPCSSNNIIEITPPCYTPFLPVHTSQVQKTLNPSLALERDLESLSLKYGIPLSNILHSLETEIFDSTTGSPGLEVSNSNLKYDGSLESHILSETNENFISENLSGDEKLLESDLINLTPLDSSLIGPHLEPENSLDDSQSYTVLSETTEPVISPHLSAKTQQTKAIKDSSLIGPQLSTLSLSNIMLGDDNLNKNEMVLSESDSSDLTSLDASLTGPHLKIGSPTMILDSHISQGDILTCHTEVPFTLLQQVKPKFNLQNQPPNLLLHSSLLGSNLPSPFKPLLSNEIQNFNEIIPLESDLTDLTPVDISQVDLTNELFQSTSPAKPILTNEMKPLESDLTDLTPVDISQVDLTNELFQSTRPAKPILTNEMKPLESDLTDLTPVDISQVDLTNELFQSTSPAKPILTNEMQTTNEMRQLESDLTDLTPVDISQIDLTSELVQSSIPAKPIVTNEIIPLESDLTDLTPVDLSQIDLTNELFQSTSPAKPILTNEMQTTNEMIQLESDLTDLTPVVISQVDLTNELFQSTSPTKPLLTNEIQSTNEMVPLESDLTDLTHSDFANEQSAILQHEKSTVTLSANPKLHKTAEYLPTNLVGEELLLKSDSSSFIPLDSSLIGPELKLGSLPVITDPEEEALAPTVSQDNLQKTDIKYEELESIILPSSLLPSLLNKPVKADSNLNIISQDTTLNEEFIEISEDANVTPLKETDFKIVEPVKPDLNLNVNNQNTQLNEKLSMDNYVEIPLADTSQISIKETDFKIIETIPELHDSNIIPLLSKDSTTLTDKVTSPVMSLVDYEPLLESSLIGTNMLPKIQRPVISSTIDSSVQLDNYLLGPSIINEIDTQSPIIETTDQLESSIEATTIDQNIKPTESRPIDSNIQFDTSLVAPSLYETGTKTSSVLDTESHLDTSLIMSSQYETVGASASSSALNQLDSSLLGTSLKPEMETLEVSHVFNSKKLDSTLVGPHLSTVPFSSDEVQMINNELNQKSEFAHLIPLDSTLIGPHVDFESQLDQSEIFQYQNPELSSTSDIAPGILETINFSNSGFVERHPPKPNTLSSIYESDLQELLSKFKNSITKSQLSPSEFKPCDNLLSSIAIQSTDNVNLSPTCSDLQPLTWNTLLNTPLSLLDDTASEYTPITQAYPEKELRPIVKGPCLDQNDYSTPQTFAELPYSQGVPQIPITPYSPSIPMKQIIDCNWIPQPINIQNILQSPGLRPAVENAPVPFISNTIMPLSPEDLKLLMDLASQTKTFPQLSMPISTLMKAIPPSLEWATLPNNYPLEKYVPILPKRNYSILPSNLESSICNSEYSPMEVDDIMSLIDENSYKLLKDMAFLPVSQSSLTPSIPVFETGEIVSPSLSDTSPILNSDFIKARPVIPVSISNAMVPSSIYTNPQMGLYNLQNIPYMTPTPKVPPYNVQPYSITPLDELYSEIVGPAPKIESLPIEPSKSYLESQWHEIPNTPQLMESIPNLTLDSPFLRQLLSKPCLKSPTILPSSLLDSMLQLPTASDKSKSYYPCQSPAVFFTPVSSALTTPLSNAYTSPVLSNYASPLSVSYAKPILTSSTRLPLNLPYAASPLAPLPISPYTASSVIPDLSSPLRPLKSMSLSNYPIAPTEIYNRPILSKIPYNLSQMYSNPYLPIHPSPLPPENSSYSPMFMSKLTPAETSPISPVFYEPLTAPYFSHKHEPKSITNFGTPTYSGLTPVSPIPMSSPPTDVLPPSYISPDLSTYKYSHISAPVNTLTQLSSTLSPAYITSISPVSSTLPSYNRPLPSKPTFDSKPKIPTQELENLILLNTLPICNANNPFLSANQMLLTSSNIPPLQNYQEHVPKWTPLSNSQLKQIKPNEDKIESNLLTTSLTEETPYEIIEENMYSDDEDYKYYEDYNFKHPLESLSYTLAPEDVKETERRPKEDFIKQEDLTLSAPITNLAFEPTPQLLPYSSPIETLPQSIFDNIPLEPSLRPLNRPTSLSASILSSPLLKPLSPLTPAVNLPLLPSPCLDTYLRPYKVLPTDENLSFSTPYYSATSQDMLASPLDPRGLRAIISPQPTSAFSQVSAKASFAPFSSPTSSPTSPYNLDDYIELPLTYNKPQSKKQDTLVKPTTVPSYNQYAAPILSHISPLETPMSSQDSSPLTPAESLKKPLTSPQYISSILNEAPLNYQPYIPLTTVPSNATKNIFKSPLVTSPYTVIPSVKIVESMSKSLNSPQWLSFTPQYSLPVSSLAVSKSSPVNSLSIVKYSTITPDVGELPMTNHIIPSSLYMSSDTDFQTMPLKKSTPRQSLPRYSYPSPTLIEPIEIVSYETPKKPLGQTILPQNIFKPNKQYTQYNGKYTAVPLPSSPYHTQSSETIDSFQTQTLPNVQYTKKLHPKLSPILAQYASPSLAPSYTSLSLETVPNSQINKPQVPQYSLKNVPIYDAPIQSPALGRNPFLKQDFKLITEVPSYSVPNNEISSLKLTPYESILLSNLKPLDISKEALESSPITSSASLSLLKPLTKTLTQKSLQYQPEMIPIDSQYVSQSQIDSVRHLLPSTSPILKSPLLKPLLTNIQNYSPLQPNHVSSSNIAFSESFPMQSLPFASSNQKYSAPSESLVSELPETLELINPVPVTPYSFLKPSLYKKYQSPVTKTNMPIYSNYDVLESSSYLPIKGRYINTVEPIEVSSISASESSRLSLDSLKTEIIEEMVPYELKPDLTDKVSQSPLNLNQQGQLYPALSYLTVPQPTHITSASSKYKTARPRPFSIPSVIPEDVELIDTTDFIPISSVQSEALTSSYSPTDREALISNTPSNIPESNTLLSSPYTILSNIDFSPSTFKQLPPKSITNTQSIQESDSSQFFPYTILSNSDFSLPTSKRLLPTIQTQLYNRKPPQPSPIYLSPQEYEELTKGLPSSQASSSSPISLPTTNIDPQLVNNLLTAKLTPLTPLYVSPIFKNSENLLQLPLFGKYIPLQETPIEITTEKENIQSLLNKCRPLNKITPLGVNNYPDEPKSSIVELLSNLDSVKSMNHLIKSKESYVEYIEDVKSNNENDYVTAENISIDENKSDVSESKSVTKSLTEIIKDVNVPDYNSDNNEQRPQRLSKLDHLYENIHIGEAPQVFTVPTFNTSPISSSTDGDRSSNTISPDIYKDFTVIPIKHHGSMPKLDTISSLPEYYTEIADSAEPVPFTNDTQNYINPSLKSYPQMELPTNAIEVTDASEIPSASYNLINNINDIKYSGHKTYQIPSLKSPKTTQSPGTPSQMYSPSSARYSLITAGEPSNLHQIPSTPEFYVPTEVDEPITPQHQAPQKLTSPLQTELGVDTPQESSEFNDYGTIEDEPVCIDDIQEDNDLKTSLINYISKRHDIKNKLDNNNQELTIPIGNIAITKKEQYNAGTIATNNPSIGLKVWKSNAKIAQAELKLKFKGLSVMNFMPVVNDLDKYDMKEIRKIVKNYIDEKYGNHIEITEPYTVDNQYTVINDFEPNAVSNKFNLLWPTNYV